MILGYFRSDTV